VRRAGKRRDLDLLRLAHVQHENIFTLIAPMLERDRIDLANLRHQMEM